MGLYYPPRTHIPKEQQRQYRSDHPVATLRSIFLKNIKCMPLHKVLIVLIQNNSIDYSQDRMDQAFLQVPSRVPNPQVQRPVFIRVPTLVVDRVVSRVVSRVVARQAHRVVSHRHNQVVSPRRNLAPNPLRSQVALQVVFQASLHRIVQLTSRAPTQAVSQLDNRVISRHHKARRHLDNPVISLVRLPVKRPAVNQVSCQVRNPVLRPVSPPLLRLQLHLQLRP